MDAGVVALGLAVVAFIGWLSRLESKTGTNERDIRREELARVEAEKKTEARMVLIEKKHYELDNRVMDKLSSIEKTVTERLSRIEGKLDK